MGTLGASRFSVNGTTWFNGGGTDLIEVDASTPAALDTPEPATLIQGAVAAGALGLIYLRRRAAA